MELQDVMKTKNIIKIAPDQTLSMALSNLKSSHDAAFVFAGDKYLGVINPYHSIIKTSLPGNAKAEHCVFHAPSLKPDFPVAKVAQLMTDSKVHYLPIFDNGEKFVGIASARHLLALYRESPVFNINIGEFLKTKSQPLKTVYDTDYVSTAVTMFKKYKVSKLIVVYKDMKLYGILTYYDLINFLITPRKKGQKGDREGNRSNFQYQLIKNFAKTHVLTLHKENNLRDALALILDKQIGSVVVLDEARTPTGIITTRDFLKLLVQRRQGKTVEITAKNLSSGNRNVVNRFVDQMGSWVKKIPNIEKIKLFVKEEKRGGVFKTVLSLIPRKGRLTVIKREGKNLEDVLKDIKKVG